MTSATADALDVTGALAASGVAASDARGGWRRGAAVVAGWTLVGAAQAVLWHLSGREPSERWGLFQSAAIPMAAAWTWAALTPPVVWLTRRLARDRPRPLGTFGRVAGHAAGALAACLALTAVRATIRALLGASPAPAEQFVFWLDVNVATYLLVAAAVRAGDLHRGYAARMRRAIRLEAQLARARLQFLQRQLQPHFLFNALNATAELTREAPEAARRMLGHLGRLLGAALEHAEDGAGEVALRAELEALEPYVEIQRTRFGDAFDFEARVAPAALDARVPSLLLQPLVENAFRHGLAGRDRGRVRVRADVWPHAWPDAPAGAARPRLRVEVADDGAGAPPGETRDLPNALGAVAPAARRAGIGLRNTRDRLRQLYGDDFRLELRRTPGTGTVALLDIPYRPVDVADVEPDARFDTAEYAAVTAAAQHAASAPAPLPASAPPPAPTRRERIAADVAGRHAPAASIGVESDRVAERGDGAGGVARGVARGGTRVPAWARFAALWLAAALFWTLQIWAFQLVRAGEVTDWLGSRRDVLGAVQWALLTPVVFWLARRFRLTRRTWARYLPLHVAAAALVDVAHVAGMWRAFDPRLPLFSALSVSPLTVNFVIYAALVAWAHGRDFGAWLRDRELADARLEAALARARWQALALELRPQLVLAVLAAAARLAPEDPARAERLIERLSDLLRAVLDASSDGAHEAAPSGSPGGSPNGLAAAAGDTLGTSPVGQALRRELAVFGACAEVLADAAGRDAHVALDAELAALDANVPPGAFGPLLDALVDALLAGAEAPAGGRAGAAGATLRFAVRARVAPGGVRVTVSADAPLFARPAALTPSGPPPGGAPAFPDAYTAVLDLAPDAGPAALTPLTSRTPPPAFATRPSLAVPPRGPAAA